MMLIFTILLASSDSCLSNAIPMLPTAVHTVSTASRFDLPPRGLVGTAKNGFSDASIAQGTTTPPHMHRDVDPVARGFMLYQSPARAVPSADAYNGK